MYLATLLNGNLQWDTVETGVNMIFGCGLQLFIARPNVISDLPFVTFIKIQHIFRSIDNSFVQK